MRIREFSQELTCIRELQSDPDFVRLPDEVIPLAILTVAKDGSLSTFGPELASTRSKAYGNFVIGNVLTDTPSEVASRQPFKRLARDVGVGRTRCEETCSYYSLCGGGFQSNRIAEHGTLFATETTTCRLHRQTLADVVLSELACESAGSSAPTITA